MKFNLQHKRYRFYCLAISGLILVLTSFIPIRIAIAKKIAPFPQAILTLGGGLDREIYTAQFAKKHPALKIWISSGTTLEATHWAFYSAGVPIARVHIDRRAKDTLTNFTSIVGEFKRRNFHHVYLITSSFHMRRAKAIATLVFGSQEIAFTPLAVPSNRPPESWLHTFRDIVRALVWLFTGRTGVSWKE